MVHCSACSIVLSAGGGGTAVHTRSIVLSAPHHSSIVLSAGGECTAVHTCSR